MYENQKINFIQRSPHDKENPFVMINKEMLRDAELKPRAKGLLCYLLSFRDDHKVDPENISKQLELSIDVTYAILREIIEAGYAYRTIERDQGKFKSWNYYFSEFKNKSTLEIPVCENTELAHNESEPVCKKPELDEPELALQGVAHNISNNSCYNKQQQHPLTPSLEKDVVVVVSSIDEKEILRLIEPYKPGVEIQAIALKMSLEKVRLAVQTLEQAIQAKVVGYPLGFLRRALEKQWTPGDRFYDNAKQTIDIEENEKIEEVVHDDEYIIEQRKEIAREWIRQFHKARESYPGKMIHDDAYGIIFSDYNKNKEIKVFFNSINGLEKMHEAKEEFKKW
ncbi:hypothetical protein UFOVP844_24 [uncultured Caudovirales phage]|uniref:Helix-turn-helix domain containing protein n=1 Tax=uncultured Caudovirales phage TaxID=2100421 RepID=A0A6J5PAV4_9CAUD|nr:hypothetical protein UFOVP844_24 [uncultured Caudovirales phage]